MYWEKKLLLVKRHILFTFFLFFVLLLGNVGSSYGTEVSGVTDKTVTVGVIGDLTGPVADIWVLGVDGIKSFFKMVNDKGGIHGRKIKFIVEDDRYSIPLALSGLKKLVYRDKVFALVGASGVGHTAAIIPLVEKEKIPILAVTSEKRFFVPVRRYIFGTVPWYGDQAKLVIEYVFNDLKLKNPTIALMYPDTVAGKDTRDAVRKLVKVYPVGNYKEVIFSMSTLDFTSEALIMKRLTPDIIYFHGYIGDTSSFAKAAYKFGFTPPIMVNQYACVDKTVDLAGKAASTLLGINCLGTWDDDSPGMKELRKASLAYDPNVSRRDSNFIYGWFLGIMLYEGFKNAGRELTREAFVKGLESMNLDTQGICGVLDFSPTDHKSLTNQRFFKADIDKKRFVPITGWRKPKE
ncbi:MAG: ABC transporter substrate-binding protein [Thermodesulfobacteriota bacterium]|nr:ABC transporter substrate-binding protein [Thermodesulfobacteriota bacterium]